MAFTGVDIGENSDGALKPLLRESVPGCDGKSRDVPDERVIIAAFADAAWERALNNEITEAEARALRAFLVLLATSRAPVHKLGLFNEWQT